ncbi:MFS transporter [Gordonia sp. NPDC003585]|uniref:CynX/NimT family MFS transporter n=1 Tax=Gordonia sp. NPDC003585 TaxID=3154275 RepID=UPI0033ABB212
MTTQITATDDRQTRGFLTVITAVGVMLVAANLRPAVVTVAPLIDDIAAEQHFSSAAAGLLTTLPVLFFGLSAPVAPRLAARFGIERTIFGSLLLLVAAMLLRFVPDTTALFVGSALIGAAIGVCNVVLPALIKRDFAHRSGLMTGLYSMTLSGGAALAAGLTVPIYDGFDGNWRLTITSWVVLAFIAIAVWVPQMSRIHLETPAGTGRVWRDKVAWMVTVFMGAQSLIFYTFTAWLPTFLMDQGYSRADAGGLLALGQVVALTCSLVVPIIAGRFADQRALTFAVLVTCGVGMAGLLTTDAWTALWIILVMSGPGSSIGLALLFMVLRSNNAAQTGQVSGMAQFLGYILAAFGPIAVGGLHDLTGSWTVAFSVLAIALAAQIFSTTVAARDVKMALRPSAP